MDISKEDREYVEIARKYGLRLNAHKLECFILFEKGYKPAEVKYLFRDLEIEPGTKTFIRTIRRYYYEWKKAQQQ